MASLSVPHFLRFTQALALVSGLGLPAAALTVGCGGETVATSGSDDDGGVADGYSGTAPCHGCGITAYDGGVMGTAPYEGDSGISALPDAGVEDGFGGVALPPDASADAELEGGGGGPLAPPDVPV